MKKLTIVIVALVLALLPTACRKEKLVGDRQFKFNATIEQPKGDDDAKVYLENEHFIIWEYDDEISIGSNTSAGEDCLAWLLSSSGGDWADYNGVFLTTLPEDSKYFLGLHPASEANDILGTGDANFSVSINLPSVQTYRTDEKGDFTFDKQVFPMVAWYGGKWSEDPNTPFNLDFHSLAAIVRLQFVNKTGATRLDSIVITSADNSKKQLCGRFTVNDYNTFDPSLTPAANTAANQTVTIDCGGLEFPQNSIKTFYLVLPAIAGRETTTSYKLTATVNSAAGSCSRTFTAKTRRNGLTYMQALEISAWGSAPAASISGNGTADRPFKVYDINDLIYLRNCYNSGDRLINGQAIDANTYIKIMRSDIVLTKDNWTSGIRNFVGHMTAMNNQTHPGIVDSCNNTPLFESIGTGGVVDGVILKCAAYFNVTSASGVSPFCTSNAGTISNCVITTIPGSSNKVLTSANASLAGICVTNTGTIDGCRFEGSARIEDGYNFAGICVNNKNGGKITGCQISATTPAMTLTFTDAGSEAAGICFTNESGGQVKDCYFATTITGSTINWGGIVYSNSGTVEHCYLSRTAHIYTSARVGGIVKENINASAKVNYCWLEGQLRGKMVGGIVDSLVKGRVVNCFNDGSDAIVTATTAQSYAGGLVCRMTGGSIENSYVNGISLMRNVNGALLGGIVGNITGGNVKNCYAKNNQNTFYGSSPRFDNYSNCYLIGGNQTYITRSSDNASLYSSLNGYTPTPNPGDYKGWQQTSAGPILVGYTTAKRRH